MVRQFEIALFSPAHLSSLIPPPCPPPSRRMGWAGHVARVVELRNAYRTFV
jgi:hypothetical protein